jgi:hypothetical protein
MQASTDFIFALGLLKLVTSKEIFDKRRARKWRPTDFTMCMMLLLVFVGLPQFSNNLRAAERFIKTVGEISNRSAVANASQTPGRPRKALFAFRYTEETDQRDFKSDLVENRTEQVITYLTTEISKREATNDIHTDKFCRFNLRCSDLKFNNAQLNNSSYRFYEPPDPLWGEAASQVRF